MNDNPGSIFRSNTLQQIFYRMNIRIRFAYMQQVQSGFK